MNYSQVGVANLALQRIGARGSISSLTDGSSNANKVNNCWNYVFAEVLSERDWKFAKLRVQLQQSSVTPVYGYKFAYGLPADFLRLVRPREKPQESRIADASYFGWGWGGFWDGSDHRDVPVWPKEANPYVVETLQTATTPSVTYGTFLLTNYGNWNIPLAVNYIRLITDLTQMTPGFANALIDRLAAELAIPVTEDKQKGEGFMQRYLKDLDQAQAQLECDDYLKDEAGGAEWLQAGRYNRGWR